MSGVVDTIDLLFERLGVTGASQPSAPGMSSRPATDDARVIRALLALK
jgi:hypothetical protein